MPFVTPWIQAVSMLSMVIILTKVSQEEKDKYHMISLVYGI